MDWKELVELLQGHRVFIQMHDFPDPDAIASAYGLQVLLQAHKVSATICHAGRIDRSATKQMLTLLPIEAVSMDCLPSLTLDDYIVTVDAQKYNANLSPISGREVACIDHHPTFIPCDYLYKDVRMVGSCATMITQYYLESGTPIPREVATALLYGLQVDTANLSRGTTDLDVDMFSVLYKLADHVILKKINTHNMHLADLKVYGAAIENIRIFGSTGIACIPFDCPDALIAMVSDFISDLEEISCSIVYAVRSDGLKFSLRSDTDGVDCGKLIAAVMDGYGSGGGHARMAGGFLPIEAFEKIGSDTAMRNEVLEHRFLDKIKQMTQPILSAEKQKAI